VKGIIAMNTARVFVVQQPAFYDRDKRAFVPKYDLSPASKHGRLVVMLGPGNIFKDRMAQAISQLRNMLATYTDSDFILAVGDPVAIAAAVLIAGEQTGGVVQLLKWDRISAAYEVFPVDIN
jgi:hypothetical protein